MTGLEQVGDLQFERGEVKQAIATYRSMMALADDPRRPSSLGPVLWFRPLQLAHMEAETGSRDAAEKTLQAFARYRDEVAAQFAPEDVRHELFTSSQQNADAHVELVTGDAQTAFASAVAVIAQIDKVKIPPANGNAIRAHDNMLRGALNTAVRAAIRIARYGDAESPARRLATVPADPSSSDDPHEQAARVATWLGRPDA